MKLRREMLLALANKTCYPDDKDKQEKIIHKYHEFIIPVSTDFTYHSNIDNEISVSMNGNFNIYPSSLYLW